MAPQRQIWLRFNTTGATFQVPPLADFASQIFLFQSSPLRWASIGVSGHCPPFSGFAVNQLK
jgi:hypothetical protein